MSERWTDEHLNKMRLLGDKELDSMVEKYLEGAEPMAATADLMEALFRSDDPRQALPPELHQFVGPSPEVAAALDHDQILRGQVVFRNHGPEIMLVLACYSLPSAYAAFRGVKVLYETGRLKEQPELRLLDTAQILLKVMSSHALDANHPGILALRKLRLLHAVMRYRVANDKSDVWDPQQRDPGSDIPLGVPLNQEDLAGTMLVFSYAILDGLNTLGFKIKPSDQEAYMATWHSLASILGIVPEMIPADFEDARALMLRIHQRQHGPSEAGQELMAALLELMKGFLPFFMRTVPASMVRFMMRSYPKVPEYIGVKRHFITGALLPIMVWSMSAVDRFLTDSPVRRMLYRKVTYRMIRTLIVLMKDHRHEDFAIPEGLEREWLANRASED